MQIKFKEPDPRAGMVVRMDSHRGLHFVNIGAAVRLNEDGTEASTSAAPPGGAPNVPSRAELDAALSRLPGDADGPVYDDPEYVVSAMRRHFGELFTDADELTVRERVKAKAKPSDGLTVPQIREALAAKQIDVPKDVTKREDLAALLDGAA